MAAQAGSAYIPIRPDLTGFHKTVQKELESALGPIVARLGKELGQDLRTTIGDGLGDPLAGPMEESGKRQRRDAPKRGGDIGGAFAGAFKRRVTDALKSLPQAEITADSSGADRNIAALRARLAELSKKTIGLDVDPREALVELAAVKRDLDALKSTDIQVSADTAAASAQLAAIGDEAARIAGENPHIQVDADTAKAIAELSVVDSEVKRLDGRKASIDIDVSAATSHLGLLAGMIGGLGPLLLGLGGAGAGALLALVGPAAAAGAGIGGLALVAVPAITRIKAALDAQTQAQTNSSATAVQAQQRALAEAGAQQQLAAAVRNAAVAHAQAVDQVRSAEQQYTTAVRSAAGAERELTQARMDARRALEDMKNQLIDVGLSVQQSRLDVDSARASLDQMRTAAANAATNLAQAKTALAQAQAAQAKIGGDVGGTDVARAQAAANTAAAQAAVKAAQAQKAARDADAKSAQLAYQQTVQRLKEQQTQLTRLQQDEHAASKAGVDGSNQVLAARQRLAAANLQITNSERALAAARANVARVDASSRDQIASAQRGVTQASLSGAAANAALTQSMAALSPAARGLMGAWQQLSAAFSTWQTSLEPTVLPVLAKGLRLVQSLLPLLTPIVKGAAAAFNSLLDTAATVFASPVWKTFASTLGQLTQSTITTFGNLALSVATTVVKIVNAFAPFAPVILGVVTQLGTLFAQIGGQLAVMAPVLAPFIGILGQLAQAIGPLLVLALQGLSPILAGLAPIFGVIIRVLQPVIAALISGLRPILAALLPVISVFIGAFGKILGALAPILPVLGQFIGSLITGLLPILTPIVNMLAKVGAQMAGALITTLKAALPSVQQIVVAIASLLPALLPLIPLWVQLELAILPLLPPILRLVAVLVQLLVPVLRFVIKILVAVAATILGILIPVLKFLVRIITIVINAVHAAFKWLYDQLIGHSIIPDLVHGIKHWFNILADIFKWVYTAIIKPIVHSIGDVIHKVWTGVIEPAFSALKTGIKRVADSFGTGAKAIKAAWDKIRGYASAPVRFVIDKVINHGILWAWDTVAKWLHLPTSLQIPYLKLPFANGGIVQYANGGVENHRAQIAPAGAMRLWAEPETGGEAYIPLASGKRERSTAILGTVADQFGYQLTPFADGGFWHGIGKVASGVLGKGIHFAKDALNAISDPAKWALDHLTKPVKKLLGQVDGTNFGRAAVSIGSRSLSAMVDAVKKLLGMFSGGGGSSMVELAKTQLGYREGAGNANKYTQEIGRGRGEEWCADFIDWLAIKTGNKSAVPMTASAPGMANAFGSKYVSGTSGAGPGDVLFFGPSKGGIYHVGLASGAAHGGTVPTIAGNSSNMVRAYTGTGIAGYAHPNYPHPGSLGSAPGSLVHASPSAAQAWGRQNLKTFGWGQGQFSPLRSLWNRESGWRWNARNPSSGAYGIPQSLPGSKMASAGSDWRDNAGTQVKWGLGYIHGRYGSPAGAWAHSQHTGWYDNGGMLQPGLTLAYNASRRPEPVLSPGQWDVLSAATRGGDGGNHNTYNLHHRDITMPQLEALQHRQETLARMGRAH